MNPKVEKTISVLSFIVFLYCAAELILMAFGAKELTSSAITVDLAMVIFSIYTFIKFKKLF